MFDRIAGRYDLLNRLMSLGTDRSWRRRTVAALRLQPGHRVLDLATGTADLALELARDPAGAAVIGLDPSPNMLGIGRQKINAAGLSPRLPLLIGDAQNLPFPDRAFDAVSIAFGIRNLPDRPQALREMRRVVRPGGRMAILELTPPEGSFLSGPARFWVQKIVPCLGRWLSGADAYRYLERSIAAFPPPTRFKEMMAQAGWTEIEIVAFAGGAATLFSGSLPREAEP